jgi:hypothetical protein
MRRVKDYNTFLKENELLANTASKQMTRILDPNYESKARVKSKDEIEASLEKDADGNPTGVWDFFEYNTEKGGFVGITPLFSGEVILREIDDEGDLFRKYEITSGTNKGLKGNFTWKDTEGLKYPEFELPGDKKWSDILGPDADFLETFISPKIRWASNISEIEGVKLKKISLAGVCEIEYEDKFQFFGNVRIYYSGNIESIFLNSYYSYEVMDGPNKGAEGKGLQIFSEEQNLKKSGLYNTFSDGDLDPNAVNPIQYGINISPMDLAKDKVLIAGKTGGDREKNGINTDQLIFLNTSDLSSIKGPTKRIFGSLNIKDYSTVDAHTIVKNRMPNQILGKIEKSKIASTKLYCYQGIPKEEIYYYKGSEFPSLDGIETSECFIAYYYGQPLILYTVEAKKKDQPSFDNKGVGTYGNNFFSGIFYDRKINKIYKVRGEWFFDNSFDQVGIIYAYDANGKKEMKEISNMLWSSVNAKIIPNQAEKDRIAKDKKAKFDAEVITSRHREIGGF